MIWDLIFSISLCISLEDTHATISEEFFISAPDFILFSMFLRANENNATALSKKLPVSTCSLVYLAGLLHFPLQ